MNKLHYIGLELVSLKNLSDISLSDKVSCITHVQNYIFMRIDISLAYRAVDLPNESLKGAIVMIFVDADSASVIFELMIQPSLILLSVLFIFGDL